MATNLLPSNLVGEWSNSSEYTRNYINTHHPRILEAVQMVSFTVRVTFSEHNLNIIGTFLSIIGSALHVRIKLGYQVIRLVQGSSQ